MAELSDNLDDHTPVSSTSSHSAADSSPITLPKHKKTSASIMQHETARKHRRKRKKSQKKISSHTASDSSLTPPPKLKKTDLHCRTYTGKVQKKSKGKRKLVTSSSSLSESYSCTDSESPDSERKTSKKHKKKKKKSCHTKHPKQSVAGFSKHVDKDGKFCDIFQKYFSNLEKAISSCLNNIASKLYSKKFISADLLNLIICGQVSDQARALKLLVDVQKKIEVNPQKLLEFMDVLKEEPSLDDLREEITGNACIRYT